MAALDKCHLAPGIFQSDLWFICGRFLCDHGEEPIYLRLLYVALMPYSMLCSFLEICGWRIAEVTETITTVRENSMLGFIRIRGGYATCVDRTILFPFEGEQEALCLT